MFGMKEKPRINSVSLESVYDIREKIGDGHFAEVNLCVKRDSSRKFAAKFIMKQRLAATSTYGEVSRGTSVADIDREAYILTNLKHENIVRLHEVFILDDAVVLILDLVTGGELFARVAECERLSEEEASNFVEQILLGVQHMHLLGVVHLDLKPENIMIEDLASRKIKIIDFGLARVLHPNETFQDMAGTPEFCAPEIINYDAITLATDMWAVGVITYILLTGISPFAGDNQLETFQNILDCVVDYTREELADATDLAKKFIQRLLVKAPRKRFTVDQCLQHSWIKPHDSMQMICRRGSLIKKQNLDGLRHFVASPSPPSSPVNMNSTMKDGPLEFFNSSILSFDKKGDEITLDVLHKDGEATIIQPSTLPPTEKEKSKSRKKKESRRQQNGSPNVTDDVSKRKVHIVKPKAECDPVDTAVPVKILDIGPTDVTEEKELRMTTESLTQAEVNKQPTNVAGKHSSGGWKSSFGHGIMGKLGAAFAAATTHSSTQPGQPGIQSGGKVVHHHKVNKLIPEVESSPRMSVDTSEESVENIKKSSPSNPSYVDRGIHERNKFEVTDSLKNPPSNQSRGTVSKMIQGFDTSTVRSNHPVTTTNHDVRNGLLKKVWNNSYSITERAQMKMWNGNSSETNTYTGKHDREPNRARVGRLQAMFESNRIK